MSGIFEKIKSRGKLIMAAAIGIAVVVVGILFFKGKQKLTDRINTKKEDDLKKKENEAADNIKKVSGEIEKLDTEISANKSKITDSEKKESNLKKDIADDSDEELLSRAKSKFDDKATDLLR